MVDYTKVEPDEFYDEEAEILSDQTDTLLDPSKFKQMESNRLKGTWEEILRTEPEIRGPVSEIDSILADNNYPIEAHISGEEYLKVSDGEKPIPDTLHMRISDTSDDLKTNIDNHFFRNMSESEKLYHVDGTPLAFEINDLFPESIPLDTDTEYLNIRVPTKQAFFEASYQEALETYRQFNSEDQISTSETPYGNIQDFVQEY
jgi:hypothetical protein